MVHPFSLYCVFNITSIFLVSFTVNHYFSTLIFLIKLAKVFSCDYFRFHNWDIYKKEHSSWQTLLIAATARLRIETRLSVRQSVYLSVYLLIYLSVHPSIPRNQNQIKSRSLVRLKTGPLGFWGSGENGYLFSGSWGALVIIFRDLRSKLIVLGIKGALQKCKKSHL